MFQCPMISVGLGVVLTLIGNVELVVGSRVMRLDLHMGFKGEAEKANVFNHNKTVVCMLDSWAHWRVPDSSFQIDSIDPSLCTQIVYRNAGIDNNTFRIITRDVHLAESLEWYRKIVGLSQEFSHLKVLLSVGGWNEGSWSFSKIAADYKKREVFVESVLRILKEYGFHGLDFAWEFPTWKSLGGIPEDKGNLALLLKDLREAFGQKYLLTLTASGDRFLAGEAYDIKVISGFVDQFNVRPFDFAGTWSDSAYHHAALKDVEVNRQSFVSTINFYLDRGAPAEKLVVGVPFYGRTFLLKKDPAYASLTASNNDLMKFSGLDAPNQKGVGFSGNWVPKDNTRVGYHELCRNISRPGSEWITFWDNFCHAPFARRDLRWVSFDDRESLQAKVELMIEKGLKGVMAWTIDTDDFKGTACRKEESDPILKYPLLRTINYAIVQEHNLADDDSDNDDGIILRSGANPSESIDNSGSINKLKPNDGGDAKDGGDNKNDYLQYLNGNTPNQSKSSGAPSRSSVLSTKIKIMGAVWCMSFTF